MNETKVARVLGWISLGLGLAEVLAPRRFTRTFGTDNRPGLVRTAYGLREIASGVGILASRNPAAWMWTRVAGDVLDLATLGTAATNYNTKRRNIAFAAAAVAGLAALDLATATKLSANA